MSIASAALAISAGGCGIDDSACQGRFVVSRTFAGGQYVVHITRARGHVNGFMDVRAGDLLASFEFDAKGNLVDKAVWVPRRMSRVISTGTSLASLRLEEW